MRFVLIFCLFFFSIKTAVGASVPKQTEKVQNVSKTVKIDSSKIHVRKFSDTAIKKFSAQKEFKYDDVPAGLSWWDRFWAWFWRLLDSIFGGSRSSKSMDWSFFGMVKFILKWLIIIVVIVLIIYLTFKIMGMDLRILKGKSKNIDVPYKESLENIHEINFEDQIDQALEQQNYRLAVRLLYLKTLKHLSDQALIHWMPEKTNQVYIQELQNENQQQEFSKLTYQFEYVWYGEFFIDQNHFELIRQSFHRFNLPIA